jgi:hypothetical protein
MCVVAARVTQMMQSIDWMDRYIYIYIERYRKAKKRKEKEKNITAPTRGQQLRGSS